MPEGASVVYCLCPYIYIARLTMMIRCAQLHSWGHLFHFVGSELLKSLGAALY